MPRGFMVLVWFRRRGKHYRRRGGAAAATIRIYVLVCEGGKSGLHVCVCKLFVWNVNRCSRARSFAMHGGVKETNNSLVYSYIHVGSPWKNVSSDSRWTTMGVHVCVPRYRGMCVCVDKQWNATTTTTTNNNHVGTPNIMRSLLGGFCTIYMRVSRGCIARSETNGIMRTPPEYRVWCVCVDMAGCPSVWFLRRALFLLPLVVLRGNALAAARRFRSSRTRVIARSLQKSRRVV